MKLRIANRRGGHPILWCGIDRVMWIDFGNFFSMDIGAFFIRLFFRIGDFSFCRYLGVIK